jgi:hypothetical protein
MVSVQAVVDHVGQKLLAPLARLKNRTVQDRIQFVKDRGSLKFIEGAFFAIDSLAPNLMGRQIHATRHLPFKSAAIELAAATHHSTLLSKSATLMIRLCQRANRSQTLLFS